MTDDSIANEIRQMLCAAKEPKNSEDEWLSTNELVEAVADFEMFSEQLQRAIDDHHRWKWTIIALHSGIQGMMVIALKGGDGLNVLREKDAKQWLDWYKDGQSNESRCWLRRLCQAVFIDWYNGGQSNESRPRDLKLAGFLELYKKIKGKWMLMYTHSQKFVPTGTQGRSIKDLNRLRNKFIHFTPKVWSLELEGLPTMVSDCLEIAEFLACQSGNVLLPEQLRERLEAAFTSARKSLSAL